MANRMNPLATHPQAAAFGDRWYSIAAVAAEADKVAVVAAVAVAGGVDAGIAMEEIETRIEAAVAEPG